MSKGVTEGMNSKGSQQPNKSLLSFLKGVSARIKARRGKSYQSLPQSPGLEDDEIESPELKGLALHLTSLRNKTQKIRDSAAQYQNRGEKFFNTGGTVLSIFATISTIGVSGLQAFLPGLTTVLKVAYDVAVAVPNMLSGIFQSVSVYYQRKKSLDKSKLKEDLLIQENELLLVSSKYDHLEQTELAKRIEKKTAENRSLFWKLKQTHDDILPGEKEPAREGVKGSGLTSSEYDTIIRKLEETKSYIRDELAQRKKYKNYERVNTFLSAIFFTLTGAVMFSPLGALIGSIGISVNLATYFFSVLAAANTVGSFFYARKAYDKKASIQHKLKTQTAELLETKGILQKNEKRSFDAIQKTIMEQQEQIICHAERGHFGIKSKTTGEFQRIFSEIKQLNGELERLKDEERLYLQKKSQKALTETHDKAWQKSLNLYSGVCYLLSAAIILAGVAYPPFGAIAIAGIGLSVVLSGALSFVGSFPIVASLYKEVKKKINFQELKKMNFRDLFSGSKKDMLKEELSSELSYTKKIEEVREKLTDRMDKLLAIQKMEIDEIAKPTTGFLLTPRNTKDKKVSETMSPETPTLEEIEEQKSEQPLIATFPPTSR
jgi:cytochrome c biogenesis protein CcdA